MRTRLGLVALLAAALLPATLTPAAASIDARPKCTFDNSTHRTTLGKIQLSQKVHYKWCVSADGVWSTPRWVKDSWRTLSGNDANCARWLYVHTRTRFSDYMGRVGHAGNTIFCHNRSHYSKTVRLRHAKRYVWGKDAKPSWLAYVTVEHANAHRNEYDTIYGHLDPFELPLVIRIFVSAAASQRALTEGV